MVGMLAGATEETGAEGRCSLKVLTERLDIGALGGGEVILFGGGSTGGRSQTDRCDLRS